MNFVYTTSVTSNVLINSLSSLNDSRAAAASTEIDIIPPTSCVRNKLRGQENLM